MLCSPRDTWLRMLLSDMPLLWMPGWGRTQVLRAMCVSQWHSDHPRLVASDAVCALVAGSGPHYENAVTFTPFALGLGMRTWDPWVFLASTDILCHPWSFCLALHMAGAPQRNKPLPSTCPGPHACCTCPSPCSQPRWSLPGQLSCLPHASAAPRTGLCKNPAGQGASKPGSSWDA